LFALSILAISALRAQQPPQLDDSQPGEVFLTPQVDLALRPVPLIVPDKFKGQVPEGEVLNLPEGFTASVFAATGLVGPRFMDWSPDGVLHVANMKVNGSEWAPTHDTSTPPAADQMFAQIVALPDRDQDGVADTVLVVAEGLWFPHSLQFYQGDLYVADMHQVVRLRDGDGDGVYEERTVVIGDLPAGHHRTRTLLIDKTTDKLYLSVGSSCDLCRETDERRATLLQADPDGSNLRVYARGLRNAIGMAFHPLTRQLWITGNGHDQEGDHLPPEAVTVVEDGGFYGWPLAYGYQVRLISALESTATRFFRLLGRTPWTWRAWFGPRSRFRLTWRRWASILTPTTASHHNTNMPPSWPCVATAGMRWDKRSSSFSASRTAARHGWGISSPASSATRAAIPGANPWDSPAMPTAASTFPATGSTT
jgi:glucose/arabinose dehydrogenase